MSIFEWEDWFAWYPVQSSVSDKWMWLTNTKRRYYYYHSGWIPCCDVISHTCLKYEYKHPTEIE